MAYTDKYRITTNGEKFRIEYRRMSYEKEIAGSWHHSDGYGRKDGSPYASRPVFETLYLAEQELLLIKGEHSTQQWVPVVQEEEEK